MKSSILFFVYVISISLPGFATGPGSIGFNETFIQQYALDQKASCLLCPTNSVARSYQVISKTVKSLAREGNVQVFREIIPLALLEPDFEGDRSHYPLMDKILALYKTENVQLILTVGRSMPMWMTANAWCPMPKAEEDWKILSHKIASALSRYVIHLAKKPGYHSWVSQKLIVEGMNEFDDFLAVDCKSRDLPSPQRAVHLQNTLQHLLDRDNVKVRTLMPSFVGVFSGYGPLNPIPLLQRSVADYYAAGGTGAPNIHIYAPTRTAAEQLVYVRKLLAAVNHILPSNFKNKLVLSEIGAPEQNASCSGGTSMSPIERQKYYLGLAQDVDISSKLSLLAYWRLQNLPMTPGIEPTCEHSHGVMSSDLSTLDPVGRVVINYLKGQRSAPN